MNVLSLCDGGSGGQQAFEMNGILFDGIKNKYFASEIADYSIKITQKNYPNTIQIGDMTQIKELEQFKKIDILLSGTPCKSLSRTNTKEYEKGLNGSSKLFYNFVDIKNSINPKYFLFENVESMSDESRDIITELLKVEPTLIDSSLFSAQERKRYYWTNIPIAPLPKENNEVLRDMMLNNPNEKLFYNQEFIFNGENKRQIATLNINCHDIGKRVYNPNMKAPTLTAVRGGIKKRKFLIMESAENLIQLNMKDFKE